MDYKGKKCLIAYFSHAGMNYVSGKIVNLKVGNTEQAAKMISRMTGGDLFHIRAAAVYPHEYKETVSLARHEWEKRLRPALARDLDDISGYDLVFLGYPNWCGTMPMAMWTFLENHDFSGKTIYPSVLTKEAASAAAWKISTPFARKPLWERVWSSWVRPFKMLKAMCAAG